MLAVGQPPHNTIKIQYGGYPLSQSKTICSSPQLLQEEEKHLFQALKKVQVPNLGPELSEDQEPGTHQEQE